MTITEEKVKYDEEIKKLVLIRLESMPPNIKIALGPGEEYTKEELIGHVKKEDSFGKEFINAQLHYLKAMKNLRGVKT